MRLKEFFKWLFYEHKTIIVARPAGKEPPTPQPEVQKGLVAGSSVGRERKKIEHDEP